LKGEKYGKMVAVGSRIEPDIAVGCIVSPFFLARPPAKLGRILGLFRYDPESKIGSMPI
jgi:hypothetical protein